jgi:DNA-binding NarL/FixJ family response regulator
LAEIFLLMSKTINILLADDHALVLNGLIALLSQDLEFHIVASAKDGREAITLLAQNNIDIAILDINMPNMTGLELTRHIHTHFPTVKVILLSMHAEPSLVRSAIDNGADGYVLKTADFEELSFAIKQVAKGKPYFDTSLLLSQKADDKPGASLTLPILSELTSREVEILCMISQGMNNTEIGEKLFISPKTVDTHRTNLMRKLNAKNAASLTRIALEAGLI